jgi:hypothetical protein
MSKDTQAAGIRERNTNPMIVVLFAVVAATYLMDPPVLADADPRRR